LATRSGTELDLSQLQPKRFLSLRLMFEGPWKILTLVGVALGLGALVGLVVLGFLIAEEQSFRREGKRVAATVTDKDTYQRRSGNRSNSSSTHYRVHYRFQDADGAAHEGHGDVSRQHWNELQPGRALEVEYVPSRPGRNRPVGTSSRGLIGAVTLVPTITGLVALVMFAIVGRRAVRNARLLGQGTVTQGVVTGKREETSITINNRHPFRVTYTFTLRDGEVRTGTDLVADLEFASKLTPGVAAGVVYLAADPAQCALFRDPWIRYFQQTGF
jgi:hypothetical protein